MTRALVLGLVLLLGACASERWVYGVPDGGSQEKLQQDLQTCRDEAKVTRLDEDQVILERSCMNDRGYVAHPAP
jgi:hypothetical protein